MTTARWILIALLTPFWWASGLMLLALVAGVLPSGRAQLFRLFDRLQRTPRARRVPTPRSVSRVAA